MSGEAEADAQNVDELKERRGEIAGSGDVPRGDVRESEKRPGDESDDASFYPDTGAYPARGEMLPPTGEMGDVSPTDALQPGPEGEPEELEGESDR
jgi:hypothetical protein